MRILAVTVGALAALSSYSAFADPFLISPVSFDFGDVASGTTSSSQEVTITNVSGTTQTLSLAGGAAGAFGGATNCSEGGSLAPGASCEVTYAFSPTGLGPATGSTTLSVNGQNASFSFQGDAIEPFLITPTSFDFGNVATGTTSSPQTVTITNVSGAAQTLSLAGGAAGVFGGATNCSEGGSLTPGASCQVTYAFTPTGSGLATGSTTLSVNGQNASFSFEGTGGTQGAPPFLISPLSLNFGNIPTGETSSPQTITITNVSGAAQTLSLAGGAAGVFGGATNCSEGESLAPGASCQVTYAFSPTGLGPATGSTTLSVNGQNASFSFEGTGLSPLLISPIGFDFGEVELGVTSPAQMVEILNVSDVSQELSLAGGAAGVFGGATNCFEGESLAPGGFCDVFYAFTPMALGLVTGSTSLSVDGNTSDFAFSGIGIAPVVSVPEPATLIFLGTGLILMAFRRRN